MDKTNKKSRPMTATTSMSTGGGGGAGLNLSSAHAKRMFPSAASSLSSTAATSAASSSSSSILTSMRRHLPKATHGHLDTLSEWSRFRTAKRFEREQQQQHLYGGRMGGGGGGAGASGSSSVFKVQVPARMVLVALAVFLVIPLSLFGWKETHWTAEQRARDEEVHAQHVRGGVVAKNRNNNDPMWMEHNLYKKDVVPEQPPSGGDAGGAGPSALDGLSDADATKTSTDSNSTVPSVSGETRGGSDNRLNSGGGGATAAGEVGGEGTALNQLSAADGAPPPSSGLEAADGSTSLEATAGQVSDEGEEAKQELEEEKEEEEEENDETEPA